MGRTPQLGDAQVEETKLADLCRRYSVRELSFLLWATLGYVAVFYPGQSQV